MTTENLPKLCYTDLDARTAGVDMQSVIDWCSTNLASDSWRLTSYYFVIEFDDYRDWAWCQLRWGAV